jgi:hypothetical protein
MLTTIASVANGTTQSKPKTKLSGHGTLPVIEDVPTLMPPDA